MTRLVAKRTKPTVNQITTSGNQGLAVQTVPTETVILSRPDSIKIKTFGVPDQDQTKTLHI